MSPRGTREYELHDQNSLVADEPDLGALVPGEIAEGHRRPLARRDGRRHARVRRACAGSRALRVQLGVDAARGRLDRPRHERWRVPVPRGRLRDRHDGAVGPVRFPALELAHHYVSVDSAPDRYRDRRVVIVGKRNSAFEIGEAISRQGVRELTLVSPRSPDLGRLARSPLRPWYLTTYDEHVRGAPGRFVLNASVDRVERRGERLRRARTRLDPAGAAAARGRRRHRRDRVPRSAARPAGARRRDRPGRAGFPR